MAKNLKILVAGDVEGKFKQLFSKVSSIQKKAGDFDMLFCVGNFFGADNSEWEEYKSGRKNVPISTFILGPNKGEHVEYFSDQNGCEMCPNVTYLGREGLYTGSSGLQIVYLSGMDGTQSDADSKTHFTNEDCNSLLTKLTSHSSFKGVDILLTSQWPKGVEKYATVADMVDSNDVGSSAISQMAIKLKPRYHFCGKEGTYYERQPYRNHRILVEGARHVTRYIAVAKVGNAQKKKFLYAFNITPLKHLELGELTKQPQDVTECPYTFDKTAIKDDKDEKAAQFFYDQKALDRKAGGQRGNKRQGHGNGGPPEKRNQPKPTGPCWFCLGSPEVEKHLVVSVGTECYIALAKGGLTNDHILITPIGHHQSTVSSPESVIEEIEQYKSALKKCFKSEGKVPVYFERNFKTQHLQIQVVPVPKEVVPEVKETFQTCAQSHDMELHEIPKHSDLKQIVPEGAPYFSAEMPTGEKMLFRIKKFFPLQFGREALADDSILNLPHRVDWRNCKESKEKETEMTADFRKTFESFDPFAL